MAERNITLITHLDNTKADYTLKLSIIRLWRTISDGISFVNSHFDHPRIFINVDLCILLSLQKGIRYLHDDSGTNTLTLFDRYVYKRARDSPELYPYDLKCLEHKKMAFKVDVNLTSPIPTISLGYLVIRLIITLSMIWGKNSY
uniref:Uncharacterized protein n=1 Tax=Lactuca sativa TaxID=4236 RepID=A0A9R1UZ61_LACSA|nr:hypothetical protein LSAT_V11C700363360 [Lactuca sativa]